MLTKRSKGLYVEVTETSYLIAICSQLAKPFVIESLIEIPISDKARVRALSERLSNVKGVNFVKSHCALTPESRFFRRHTIESMSKAKESGYFLEVLEKSFKVDPNKHDAAAINVMDGQGFSPDKPMAAQKELIISGANRAEMISLQDELVDVGIYPVSLQLSTLSCLGSLKSYLTWKKLNDTALMLEISADSSNLFIFSSDKVDLCRPIPFGINSMFPVIQRELGLKDESSARKLFQANTFDFTELGSTLLRKALKEVQVANPVIMLDEIDKVGASYRGDPASALLEVLDPEQNAAFLDHYLDLRVDLSRVLFICTANQLDTIPGPLLDRMETIRLSGYIAEEKLAIARNHLWPKQLERHGIAAERLRINDAALRHLIESYCREAGVRHLEQQLARIMRKSVRQQLQPRPSARVRVGKKDVETLLGKPVYVQERPSRGVGVAKGLAWTALGGATLAVESSQVHTLNRGFKLTGKLGEVMKESAEIAYSFVVAHLRDYGCDPEFFDTSMVHLHVPEGATPKDGPSAGITMATALISLARRERLRRPLAMSGELTLTGQVLAVGGIREKVVAARRAKLTELVLPHANRRDVDALPDYLREGLSIHFVRSYTEVFECVFQPRRRDLPLH